MTDRSNPNTTDEVVGPNQNGMGFATNDGTPPLSPSLLNENSPSTTTVPPIAPENTVLIVQDVLLVLENQSSQIAKIQAATTSPRQNDNANHKSQAISLNVESNTSPSDIASRPTGGNASIQQSTPIPSSRRAVFSAEALSPNYTVTLWKLGTRG